MARRRVWMRRWWMITVTFWLTIGVASVLALSRTWEQLADYFTWTALRYGLAFNRLAALGLGLCLGLTVALLVKEARFMLFGLTQKERHDLLQAIRRESSRRQT